MPSTPFIIKLKISVCMSCNLAACFGYCIYICLYFTIWSEPERVLFLDCRKMMRQVYCQDLFYASSKLETNNYKKIKNISVYM